jgi:hypothetical protein
VGTCIGELGGVAPVDRARNPVVALFVDGTFHEARPVILACP